MRRRTSTIRTRLLLWTQVILLTPTMPALGRAETERTWQFEILVPQWLATEHGHLPVGGVTTPVNVGFDELFNLMGNGDLLGGSGRFEAHNRDVHLTLFADAVGVVIDSEELQATDLNGAPISNGKKEIDSSLVFVEFGGGYRFGPWKIDRGGARHFWAEPIVGGRYTKMEQDLELRENGVPFAATASDVDWVDPFIGGRWMLDLFPALALTFRGDIGGFDAGSELAWSLVSTLVYRLPWTLFSTRLLVVTGYRVIDFEYEDDGGRRDLNFRGPLLGLGATF